MSLFFRKFTSSATIRYAAYSSTGVNTSIKSLTHYSNSGKFQRVKHFSTSISEMQPSMTSSEQVTTSTKLRSLSLHRPNHFPTARQIATEPVPSASDELACDEVKEHIDPASILFNPHYNKGTAFTSEERKILHLEGLLPKSVEDIETQVRRCYKQFCRLTVPMSKHIYLNSLRERNETLFYKLIMDNLAEMMPFIYTPTVGQACLEYGLQFRHAEGMYISRCDKGRIRQLLDNWKPNVMDEVSIIVATDGSRILGLGDLGACGMGIPVGKLSLYVAAGGFHPATTLPVVIDAGTDNKALLEDEFYLGQRHPRLPDSEYYELVEEFMTAVKEKWPGALLQFEDFSNNHCFELLEKYRKRQLCFNDDIQGTGAVIAAGFLNALKLIGTAPRDCRVLFLGAGSAGIGVAETISKALQKQHGLTEEECRKMFYMVDSKGLVTLSRGDKLTDFKVPYARQDIKENIKELVDIVRLVKPTALIGLSGQSGAFNSELLRLMGELNERPIIFPLSNPTAKAECSFQDAYDLTNGRVVFASGSPFDPITTNGKTYVPSQGNNLYTFPGLGYGAWLARAECVSDEMVTAATIALANSVTQEDLDAGALYPALSKVRDVSAVVAAKVIECALKQGIARIYPVPKDLISYVQTNRYFPRYLEWNGDEDCGDHQDEVTVNGNE